MVIRKIIDDANDLWKYVQERDQSNEGDYNDGQAFGCASFYSDSKMNNLHERLLPKIENIAGLQLFPTYTYWRMYKKDTILRIHTDRDACEISVSICLGYVADQKWPFYILDKEENPARIELNQGDGVLYLGVKQSHWRPKFNGERHAQLFLHYVDKDGHYADWKDDRR